MTNANGPDKQLPQRAETTNPDWNAYVPQGRGRTDEQVRADIHELLSKEDGHRTSALQADVKNGVVTLRGRVRGATESERLLSLIRGVPSVDSVVNQLDVEAQSTREHATELASDGYAAAQERVRQLAHRTRDIADDVRHYGSRVGERAADYSHRAGARAMRGARAPQSFTSAHALPLAFVGASLGFLWWSMRREARANRVIEFDLVAYGDERAFDTPYPTRQPRSLAPSSAPTTDGSKLLGVRTGP